MKTKNIVILAVIGLDLLFGMGLFAIGLLGGDFASDDVGRHLAVFLALGTIFGAAISLWKIKEAVLGRNVLNFIIYVILLLVLFFASIYGSLITAIILLVLDAICAVKAVMGLRS